MNKLNSCASLIKQINDSMEKDANNDLREKDITMSQCSLLMVLSKSENMSLSMKELEKILRVSQPTVVGIVNRLSHKNLVVSYGSEHDKRIKMVRITDEGLAIVQRTESDMENAELRLVDGLNEDEKKEFQRLLRKVRDSLK